MIHSAVPCNSSWILATYAPKKGTKKDEVQNITSSFFLFSLPKQNHPSAVRYRRSFAFAKQKKQNCQIHRLLRVKHIWFTRRHMGGLAALQ